MKSGKTGREGSTKHGGIHRERRNAILKAIIDSRRITRDRLSELLRLSPSSIVKYTKILLEQKLIREMGKEDSTGGRRSLFLEITPDAGLSIGVVVDLSSMRGVLMNAVGEILEERDGPTRQGIERDEWIENLFKLLAALVAGARKLTKPIPGIGIAIGGFIDPRAGISHEFFYAKNWYDVPLKQLVEERFGITCHLVSHAAACALGEKNSPLAAGIDNLLCVWLGDGVCVGIVMNGEPYGGATEYAGCLGHAVSVEGGALCYCGHTGCLETVCSRQVVLAACREGLRQGVSSEAMKLSGGNIETLTIESVIEAANRGDRFARNCFPLAGLQLGIKLSDVANLLNPALIVLRGPLIDGNAFLAELIERTVLERSLRQTARSLRVAYSEEARDIRLDGVRSVIMNHSFSG